MPAPFPARCIWPRQSWGCQECYFPAMVASHYLMFTGKAAVVARHSTARFWLTSGLTPRLITYFWQVIGVYLLPGKVTTVEMFSLWMIKQRWHRLLKTRRYSIDVLPLLCPDNTCPLISGGKLVYRDGDHLSEYGASLLAPLFLRYFEIRTAAKNELHG